jgi:hypothetical protein
MPRELPVREMQVFVDTGKFKCLLRVCNVERKRAKCQMEGVDEKRSLLAVAKQWWNCYSQARSKEILMSSVLM